MSFPGTCPSDLLALGLQVCVPVCVWKKWRVVYIALWCIIVLVVVGGRGGVAVVVIATTLKLCICGVIGLIRHLSL